MKALLFILFFILSGCNIDDIVLCSSETAEGNDLEIDATDSNSWIYYRFNDEGDMMMIGPDITEPENTVFWDIAFQRYHIKTNSGESGTGTAGAYMYPNDYWTSNSFNATTTFSNNLEFTPDGTVYTFYTGADSDIHGFTEGIANPVLETYVSIDTLNSYIPIISNNRFIVRSNTHLNFDGSESNYEYYKLWVYQYNSGVVSLIYNQICIEEDCE